MWKARHKSLFSKSGAGSVWRVKNIKIQTIVTRYDLRIGRRSLCPLAAHICAFATGLVHGDQC